MIFCSCVVAKGRLADSHCKALALCHATVIKLFWDHGFSKVRWYNSSQLMLTGQSLLSFSEGTQFFRGLLEHVEMLVFDNPWLTVGQTRHVWFLPINKHLQYSSLILRTNFQPLSVSQVSHRGCRIKCSSRSVSTWMSCPSAHLHRIFKRKTKKKQYNYRKLPRSCRGVVWHVHYTEKVTDFYIYVLSEKKLCKDLKKNFLLPKGKRKLLRTAAEIYWWVGKHLTVPESMGED